jgi:hypothetical protein
MADLAAVPQRLRPAAFSVRRAHTKESHESQHSSSQGASLEPDGATGGRRGQIRRAGYHEIRHSPVREPISGNRYSFLKVTTRAGLIGWGECGYESRRRSEGAPGGMDQQAGARPCHDCGIRTRSGSARHCASGYRGTSGESPGLPRARRPDAKQSACVQCAVFSAVPCRGDRCSRPGVAESGQGVSEPNSGTDRPCPADGDFVLSGNGVLTPGDAASVAATVEKKHPRGSMSHAPTRTWER